jgi:hypothetical protein
VTERSAEAQEEIEHVGAMLMDWADLLINARSEVFDAPHVFKAARGDSAAGFAQARAALARGERLAMLQEGAIFMREEQPVAFQAAVNKLRHTIECVEILQV